MKRKLGFTLTLVLGLTILLVAGIGLSCPANAAERALPAQSLAASSTAGGGPIDSVFTVTNESLQEVNPAVAYNPDREEYLVVWHNDRSGNDDVRFQRVSKSGELIGPARWVSSGPTGEERRYPDVAYSSDDQEYLVVWEHYHAGSSKEHHIYGRRISGTGSFVTSEFWIFNSDVSMNPAVAYGSVAQEFLIVWEWFDLSGYHIMGRTYSPSSGRGTTDYISQDPGTSVRSQPDVAYCRTRNEHLVVWRQGSSGDIHARRVTGGGAPLDPSTSISISTLGHDEEGPVVAALPITNTEGDYLVAWEIDTGSDTGIDAKTVHVASDGSATVGVLPQIVYDSSENESNPSVVGSESNQQYLVAWTQHYAISSSGGGMSVTIQYDGIAGRAISKGGELLNGTFMDAGAYVGGWDADHSAVAAGPLGDFLVVYEDTPLGESDSDINGRLWGNRIYLPLVLRD